MSSCHPLLASKKPFWSHQFASKKEEFRHLEENPFFWMFLEKYIDYQLKYAVKKNEFYFIQIYKNNNIDQIHFHETLIKVLNIGLRINTEVVTENNEIFLKLIGDLK